MRAENQKKTEHLKKKESDDNANQCTLFVRNIGWDTTEEMFKEHMAQFGAIKYAVLCKPKGDLLEGADQVQTHKGTGFVRYKTAEDAQSVLEISKNLESKLTEERTKKDKLSKTEFQDKALLSSASLLKGELELNGRRLVVMPQVARTKVSETLQENKDRMKGVGEDRRNLALKKEGLLNEASWIHKEPALTSKDLEQRQKLFIEKDTALKKSPNLAVASTRLQLRNLPKKQFYEPEVRALMVSVVEAYKKAMDDGELPKVKLPKLKKTIVQVKVLRDGEKTIMSDDGTQQLKLASGLAFVEFYDRELALFAVRYLNNMQLSGSRGLIVDFALQDARKLKIRSQKLEKYQKIAEEKRVDAKKEARLAKRAKLREE